MLILDKFINLLKLRNLTVLAKGVIPKLRFIAFFDEIEDE